MKKRDPESSAYKVHKYENGPMVLEAAAAGPDGMISWWPVARLPHNLWVCIAAEVHRTFVNQRGHAGVKTLRPWGGWTGLQRHEGKELLILIYGIEALDPSIPPRDAIHAAVQNWRGLAPEERWWLASQTEATRGRPGYAEDRGWRQALKHILLENPA